MTIRVTQGDRSTSSLGEIRSVLALGLALLLLAGCASEAKPKRDSLHRWYQGTMDTEDRTFFVDSFFNGR